MLIASIHSLLTKDYAIDVEAIKDEQDLFTSSRVDISNVGRKPLTNIIVSFMAAMQLKN
jgi:hypothetical protein